jgi:hypothetical protein
MKDTQWKYLDDECYENEYWDDVHAKQKCSRCNFPCKHINEPTYRCEEDYEQI